MDQALVVLVTGLVVVFAMLIVLIAVIKIYSTIIVSVQKKSSKKKASSPKQSELKVAKPQTFNPELKPDNGDIPYEVIAAISAAVAYLEGDSTKICKIQKVTGKKSRNGSAWGRTGRIEATNPF